MSALPRMKPILPWWQLGALLVLAAAGIYLLLPDDPGLLEKLIRDRKLTEARRLLETIPPGQRARDTDRLRLLELRLARFELAAADSAALERFWRRAVAAWTESNFARDIFLELSAVVPQLRDLAAAWEIAQSAFARAPENQRASLGPQLVRAALAHSQPATAAEVFAATNPAASRTVADTLELARLWQLAGRPADALDALGERQEPEIAERRIGLLRALNRSREALALLRSRLETQPAPDAAAIEELATIALQAGAPAAAVPAHERFLAANPDDLVATRRLRSLLVAAAQPGAAVAPARRAVELSGRDPADLRELARLLEWSGSTAGAFDAWLELARQGDLPALDRLVALNPGLFRDADLASALERAVPVPGHDDYTLMLARLQIELGRYDEARARFERYLAQAPDDFAATVELAHLESELFHFEAAEQWLHRAAALKPDNVDVRREIAESLMFQGRDEEALTAYLSLAENPEAGDEVLGPLVRIAESLGRYELFARALRLRIDRSPQPDARDYQLLAYAYELANDQPRRRAALEEGLARFPADGDLRLQLALTLAARKQFRSAQDLLAQHHRVRSDPGILALQLEMMRLNQDTTAERRFLSEPLPPAVLEDENVVERLAIAHEALGDFAAAEPLRRRLHERFSDDVTRAGDLARVLLELGRTAEARRVLDPFLETASPSALKLVAEIAAASGDHHTAERYQRAYLDATPSATAAEWGALGDIRLALGDRAGAKQAYTEALRRLHAAMAQRGVPR